MVVFGCVLVFSAVIGLTITFALLANKYNSPSTKFKQFVDFFQLMSIVLRAVPNRTSVLEGQVRFLASKWHRGLFAMWLID